MKDFQIINHIQTAVAVIDKNMTIVEANAAFQQRHNAKDTNLIGSKCFSAAYQFHEQCNYKKLSSCPLKESFNTKNTASVVHHFWINGQAIVEQVTTTPIVEENGDVNFVVEEFKDMSQLLGLEKGILGVCSYCKKIRDDDGQWLNFDAYLHKHTGADFSHGICEECHDSLLTELTQKHSSSS